MMRWMRGSKALFFMFLALSLLTFSFTWGEETRALRPNSIWKLVMTPLNKEYTVFPIVYGKRVFIDVLDLARALNSNVNLDWEEKVITWRSLNLVNGSKKETGKQVGNNESSSPKSEGNGNTSSLYAMSGLSLGKAFCPRSIKEVKSLLILGVKNNVKGVKDNSQVFSGGEEYLYKKLKDDLFNSGIFLIVPSERVTSFDFSPQGVLKKLKELNLEVKPDAVLVGRLNRYEFRIEEREWTTPLVEVDVELALVDASTGGVIWYNRYRIEDTRFNAFNTTNYRKRKLLRWLLEEVSRKTVMTLKSYKEFVKGSSER